VRSLEIRTATLGPDHADTGDALLMVASAHDVRGDVAACREYTLRAVEVHERALGPKHPTVALSLANLGAVYYHANEFDRAAEALERALAIQRAVHPDGHPDLVITLNTLGNVQRLRKDYAAATALYVEALALGERTLTAEHPLLAFPLTGRGQTLLEEGRPAEAVAPLERARAIRANPDVPSHMRAFTAFHLAQALWDADLDRVRARSLAEEAAKSHATGGEAEAEDFALVQRWLAQHEGE
jgi:tetratricopeptide (TPR) repeat protein